MAFTIERELLISYQLQTPGDNGDARPANMRCMMGYVVDLTIIMQAIFRISLADKEGAVDQERVTEIVNKFDESDTKKEIHEAVRAFVEDKNLLAREGAVGKLEELINNHMGFLA